MPYGMVDVVKLCNWWENELQSVPPELATDLLTLRTKYNGQEVPTRADQIPDDVATVLCQCIRLWFKQHPYGGVLHIQL